MFRNKLIALEHPFPDSIDGSCPNDQEFASTILWLEDQKIRFYTIDDREGLRDIGNVERWNEAYEKYKVDIGCPQLSTRTEDLCWFLSYAVRLEYTDRADVFKSVSAAQISAAAKKPVEPVTSSKNPFDSMDLRGEDFERNVRKLGQLLNIAHHPDHLKVLEAAARVIQRRLGPDADRIAAKKANILAFSLKDTPKFAFDDADLDEAAKILRLLQIDSVRHLQTTINETIVAVQELTANPKTDTKLGKVGF